MQSPPVSPRAGIGGPKTLEGKLRSARNAVKHGLSSAAPVILEFETSEAWEAYRAPLVESLHPATAASLPVWECHLAEEIALTMWRRRRIPLYEARLANARMQIAAQSCENAARKLPPNATEEHFQQILYCAYTEAILPPAGEGDHLIRYEAHLGRQLTRLFRELHYLQKLRNCETNSPPLPEAPPGATSPAPHSHPSPHEAPTADRSSQNCKTNSPPAPGHPSSFTLHPSPFRSSLSVAPCLRGESSRAIPNGTPKLQNELLRHPRDPMPSAVSVGV